MSFLEWYERYIMHPCAPRIAASLENHPELWEADSEERVVKMRTTELQVYCLTPGFTRVSQPVRVKLGWLGRNVVHRAAQKLLRDHEREVREIRRRRVRAELDKAMDGID